MKYKEISMLNLRREAENIVREVAAGQVYILTYRGKPMIKLSPIGTGAIENDDPFYKLLDEIRSKKARKTTELNNDEIDRIVYE